MPQWFSVSANAALNNLLNSIHKSSKLQNNSNVMDWANVKKNTISPICQTPFYPLTSICCPKTISLKGMARYRKSLLTSHSVMEMCSHFMDTKYKCLTRRTMADISDTLFSQFYVMWVLTVYFSQINCQSKAWQALYCTILLTTPGSN